MVSGRFVIGALSIGSALFLAACSSGPGPGVSGGGGYSAPVAEPIFTAEGVTVGATGMEIDFGRAEAGAITGMSRLMGGRPVGISNACNGMHAARWKDGTTLFFEQRPYDEGAFVGWIHDGQSAGRICA